MNRERHLLNADWHFSYGEHPGAEAEPPSPHWYDVGLPHSFSLPDFREAQFYVGYGCYRRVLSIPPTWAGSWIALEFLGVFQVAEVYVNGRHVGRHAGGYTPFVVDITDALVPGENDLFVRVDNTWNARLAPRGGDYSFTGGIYRDVSVLVADRVHIDWHGVGVTTPRVDADAARVVADVDVVNLTHEHAEVTVTAEARAGARTLARLSAAHVSIRPQRTGSARVSGRLERPVLWDLDTPHLYDLVVTVAVDGVVRDEDRTPFGVRSIEFTADRGFFLNGRRIDLHGVNVHQNRGGWSDAGTRASIRRDVEMVKDAGFNIIRGSHYPHHLAFAQECDRQGVLFWSELHFWGIGGENIEGYWFASAYPVREADEPDFEESLRTALREMIRTQRNNPSIITWSVGNEAFFSEDSVIDKARALTSDLVALAHALDPSRPVSVGGAQRKGFDMLGDVAGYNGDGAELFHDPGIPNLVAEYHGVAGRGSGDFDVEWQYGVGTEYPWRSGKILWAGFHYKTIVPDFGRHGLIDYFRNRRRPYFWYRQALRGIDPPAFPVGGRAARLQVEIDTHRIPTDGTADARLTVTLWDDLDRRVAEDRAITLTVIDGEGLFPSGRSITLSPETESVLDGEASIELRSYRPGSITVRVESAGLASVDVTIDAEGDGRAVPSHPLRLAPPAPYLTPSPRGNGRTSLTAFRPVTVSSAATGHPGSHATQPESGEFWRPAADGPGEWIVASMEFDYSLRRIDLLFAEDPRQPWILETITSAHRVDLVHRAPASTSSQRRFVFELPGTSAAGIRVRFPSQPLRVEEINAFDAV